MRIELVLTIILTAVLTIGAAVGMQAQDEEKVTVPKRLLTQQQLEQMNNGNLRQNVSAWTGIGKEVGEAVNSSLQAITTQSNNFAQTGVGKVTVAIVVWKIFGDLSKDMHDAFH